MIGKSLRYYRMLSGKTQDALAEDVGISKMAISYYEAEKRTPSPDILEKLCSALNISVSKLLDYQDGPVSINIENIGEIHGAFRKKTSLSPSKQEFILACVEQEVNKYLAAAEFAGVVLESTLAKIVVQGSNATETAENIRDTLGIPKNGPIANLTQAMEDADILVIMVEIPTDNQESVGDFSGFCFWSSNGLSVVAVNSALSVEQQRFALAHELVHLLVTGANENGEDWIDDIARHFLLTSGDIRKELGFKRKALGRQDIEYIQTKYGVSASTVITRASQEHIISDAVGARASQIRFSPIFNKESPTRLRQMVCRAYYEGEIGIGKVAEMLRVSIVEARDMCGVGVSAEW